MLRYLWLIPLLPFVGFVVNGLFGPRAGKRFVTVVGCGTVFVAFLLSCAAVWDLAANLEAYEAGSASGLSVSTKHRRAELMVWEWIPGPRQGSGEAVPGASAPPSAAESSGEAVPETGSGASAPALVVPWLLTLDPLSAVMLLVVTGVGFLIHVYSTGYMAEDAGYWRFFAYLNLFMASMLTLVLGGAFPVMFVGWEGVGLCSYLLIAFWYEGEENAQAGRKAFITNRIGDAGFILGVLILWGAYGTMEISGVMEGVRSGAGGVTTGLLTAAALLLFVGAAGKSAQIPLYVWLPDAMAGPTPVSALIHAATMVTAGVYMVCRCSALYEAAPAAMWTVAIVGAATALFAATIGLAQNDIKKVLAYSTVSQLGYMFLGAGVGAFTGTIFHLTTHAFFKALLFLGSGAVIHALHHEQDMRKMGGLKEKLPWTYGAFLMGWLAIAGIVPWSGFFSKDELLLGAFEASKPLWLVGLVGAGLTALYMTRLIGLTFWGESRVEPQVESKVHEAPAAMKWVLVALAVLSVFGGVLGLPGMHFLEGWLQPVFHPEAAAHGAEGHHVALGVELALMGASLLVAGIGIAIGWSYYRKGRGEKAERVARRAGGVYRLIRDKYRIDELYDATVLRAYYWLCDFSSRFDIRIVDGLVNGARHMTVGGSYLSAFWDSWVVDGLVNLTGYTVRGGSWVLRKLQSGFVQAYAATMVFGLFVLLCVYLFYMS
jgi:NADH-quinone oxidoreductase subunit L